MKDNGLDLIDRDVETNSGQMELSMKDPGRRIRLAEKENLLMRTLMNTKDNGKTIKQMVLELTFTLNLRPNTKVIGKMT